MSTAYTYDNLSRLLQALHQKGSTLVEGAAYTYDAAGNRLTRAETTPGKHGTGTQTDAFSYDAIYELTQAATNGNTTDLDTYDAVGNRLTDWFGGTYNYNSSNELTAYPGYSWTYDNNGNTSSKIVGTSTTTYNWDFENRLTSVVLPGTGGTVSFKYDPFGRRIYKSSSTGTTIYAYDGDNRIEDLSSTGTATARYTQGLGIDEPLEVYEGRASYYYHADGLGSIVALTSSRGSAVNTYFEYNTFGADPDASETVANPFRFTAREWDSETSLYYYRARYYDSLFGRFLSEDPIRFSGGANFYDYAFNSPATSRDPKGLFPTSWHRNVTYDLALAVFGGKCADKARAVADADAAVDDFNHEIGWSVVGSVIGAVQFAFHGGAGWAQPGPHFPSGEMLEQLHNNAIWTCSLKDLGESLHSRQDAYAHSGWSSFDHYTHGTIPDTDAANNLGWADAAMLDTVRELTKFKESCLLCCR